jgi:hypothetical protein
MALKGFQSNVLSDETALVKDIFDLEKRISAWAKRYNNGGIVNLVDDDLTTVGDKPTTAFEHLTMVEVKAARDSLLAVAAAIVTNTLSLDKMIP